MPTQSLASRLARAETFAGFDDEDADLRRPPTSIASMAFRAAVRLAGGPADPLAQTQEAQQSMRALQTKQAAGKVLIVRNVPYVEKSRTDKQNLDVYLPRGPRRGLPLLVHFHGGGWLSGDRTNEMFGAPAVARSHAAAGCVVVTPSYRLGDRDAFMEDAQRSVLWAVANAAALGANPDRLYLSGHSAGGNLAALLGVGPWLVPPHLPPGAVKGVIGISGVYTLLRPLGGFISWYTNGIFDKHMRRRVFGDDPSTLAKHSPSALVRLGAGDEAFKPSCLELLGRLFSHSAVSVVSLHAPAAAAEEEARGKAPSSAAAGRSEEIRWAAEVPPVLLLNASWDLGLEDDAAHFARSLAARTARKPEHHVIPNTNHATVSWDERSFRRCREFIAACEQRAAVA